MDAKKTQLFEKALNATLNNAIRTWRAFNIKEAREIAETLISMKLAQIDLRNAKGRADLISIATLLSQSNAPDAVLEICYILREQQQNATAKDQVMIASLLNRVCLLVGPNRLAPADLAA